MKLIIYMVASQQVNIPGWDLQFIFVMTDRKQNKKGFLKEKTTQNVPQEMILLNILSKEFMV
jgi:hypothetical protein